ncbi:MAG: hypothetical protein H7070_11020 [Saprospiraceae bacterium]|nr:hypothetical protein [Pyrinomonadaceae bacterium]
MTVPIPKQVSNANVVAYTVIDERHRHTGNCEQIVAGVLMGAALGLAICQYDGETSFYLFGCDENWDVLTDTWHETLADAKEQAEFEYDGISATWNSFDEILEY